MRQFFILILVLAALALLGTGVYLSMQPADTQSTGDASSVSPAKPELSPWDFSRPDRETGTPGQTGTSDSGGGAAAVSRPDVTGEAGAGNSDEPFSHVATDPTDFEAVTGIVIDARNQVIAGQPVQVFDYATLEPLTTVDTDARGRFRIQIGRQRVVALRAARGKFATALVPFAVAGNPDYILRLSDPAVISGRVIDEISKSPVPEFTLVLQQRPLEGARPEDSARRRLLPEEWRGEQTFAVSDAEGDFVISGVAPGRYVIYVYADGYGMELYAGKDTPGIDALMGGRGGIVVTPAALLENIVIPLHRSLPARGTVTDRKGKPLEGARVTPYFNSGMIQADVPVPEELAAVTDSSGRFELDLGNRYRVGFVRFEKEGYAEQNAHFYLFYTMTSGDSYTLKNPAPTIQLADESENGVIFGSVLGEGDVPVAGQLVIVQNRSLSRRARTDDAGTFYFSNLPPGEYMLYAENNFGEFNGGGEKIRLNAGEEVERVFRTARETAASGRVRGLVTAGNDVLRQITLEISGILKNNAKLTRYTLTDENGEYAFYNIDDGDYTIRLLQPDRKTPFVPQAFQLEVARGNADFDIELPGGKCSGWVRDKSTGRPVETARVYFVQQLEGTQRPLIYQVGVNGDGSYEAVGVAAGRYDVRVWERNYGDYLMEQPVTVAAEQHLELPEILLQKTE